MAVSARLPTFWIKLARYHGRSVQAPSGSVYTVMLRLVVFVLSLAGFVSAAAPNPELLRVRKLALGVADGGQRVGRDSHCSRR